MKTLYLKSNTKTSLIADIASVIEGYAGEVEFGNETIQGHWIGKIPSSVNHETGEILTWKAGFHANLLVPNDFDESIFTTLVIPPPSNPVHQFA